MISWVQISDSSHLEPVRDDGMYFDESLGQWSEQGDEFQKCNLIVVEICLSIHMLMFFLWLGNI